MKNKDVENFLKENNLWGTQCFNTRNMVGDDVEKIYDKDKVFIMYCKYWDYIEVFGLDDEDFKELEQAHEDSFNEMMKEYEKKQNLCNI